MAIFGKQTCAHCGGNAGAVTRIKLADEKYICFDCSLKIPKHILNNNFMKTWNYDDFVAYLEHMEQNKKQLESFNITDVYFDNIYVDMDKGWMTFSYSDCKFYDKESMLEKNPDIFDMKTLTYFDFFYNIKDVKDGFLSAKVKADVRLIIAFNNRWYPYSYNAKVLKNHRHKAEVKGLFNKRVSFTDNEKKEDLQIYLISSIIENNVNVPVALGKKLTMNFDFSPYDQYLRKVFELKKLGVYKDDEFDQVLDEITPSSMLKRKLKSIYKK